MGTTERIVKTLEQVNRGGEKGESKYLIDTKEGKKEIRTGGEKLTKQ